MGRTLPSFPITIRGMLELLSYGFMQRALLGGIGIALAASLLGPFLVLRRQSLLGDGLAHAAFGGIAMGLLLGIHPLVAAIAAALIAALLMQGLVERSKVYSDTAIAVILSLGMATAIVIIGAVNGFNVNLFSYLFGSILTISSLDLVLIFCVLALIASFIFWGYRSLVLLTFHEELAKLSGVRMRLLVTLFSVLTALAVVISIRAVGIVLVTALLVIPAATALQTARSFFSAMGISSVIAVLSLVAGILLSYYLDLPPGGMIVMVMCLVFFIVVAYRKTASKRH